MKIITIVGARPQFVKAAVVSRALRQAPDKVDELLVHTGQHYDDNMSRVFFEELGVPKPSYNLGIGGGSHGQNTGRMLEAIETVLLKERPDWVLVYGDTDSTLAGTLASVKLHIPVAHVEAGLRSFNRAMPEELNRVLTDHASSLLFTPTAVATSNLNREGIETTHIRQVGDVMFDAALFYSKLAEDGSKILSQLGVKKGEYALATLHRAENTDSRERLAGILEGLAQSPLPVVLPLHPRTAKRLGEYSLELPKTVLKIDPIGYLDMMKLEKNASLIATDSGGIQKEAYFHQVPCITLRDETEWKELVEIGANRIVGADPDVIGDSLKHGCSFPDEAGQLYGDGTAAQKIAKELLTT